MIRYKITNELKEAIRNSGFSLNEINKKCGFNIRNIYYVNKSINGNHLFNLANFLKININKLNLKEIKFDYLKNFGYKIYKREHLKDKKKKRLVFQIPSKEFAEFMGIMLGDGGIYQNQITVVIDSRDLLLKEHIKNLFNSLFGLNLHEYKQKDQNAVKLYRCNKNIVEILLKYGLKRGDKIKNGVGVPNWIKSENDYIIACLRGLILTDGCLYYCKRERKTYVKFTNHCFNLLNDFKDISNKIGFNFAKANKYNKTLYRQDQVARFINTLDLTNLKGMSASLESQKDEQFRL